MNRTKIAMILMSILLIVSCTSKTPVPETMEEYFLSLPLPNLPGISAEDRQNMLSWEEMQTDNDLMYLRMNIELDADGTHFLEIIPFSDGKIAGLVECIKPEMCAELTYINIFKLTDEGWVTRNELLPEITLEDFYDNQPPDLIQKNWESVQIKYSLDPLYSTVYIYPQLKDDYCLERIPGFSKNHIRLIKDQLRNREISGIQLFWNEYDSTFNVDFIPNEQEYVEDYEEEYVEDYEEITVYVPDAIADDWMPEESVFDFLSRKLNDETQEVAYIYTTDQDEDIFFTMELNEVQDLECIYHAKLVDNMYEIERLDLPVEINQLPFSEAYSFKKIVFTEYPVCSEFCHAVFMIAYHTLEGVEDGFMMIDEYYAFAYYQMGDELTPLNLDAISGTDSTEVINALLDIINEP